MSRTMRGDGCTIDTWLFRTLGHLLIFIEGLACRPRLLGSVPVAVAVAVAVAAQISGGEWKRDLLFVVPRDHPEIERLEGRYKK